MITYTHTYTYKQEARQGETAEAQSFLSKLHSPEHKER